MNKELTLDMLAGVEKPRPLYRRGVWQHRQRGSGCAYRFGLS
jgi:hypothetical protein